MKQKVQIMSDKNKQLEKRQVQRRMKRLTVPCDKLSKLVFEFSAEEYADAIKNHTEQGCIEREKTKTKSGEILPAVITRYQLEHAADYTDLKPLDAFHREILFALIAAREQGFTHATFSMTLDTLTGGDQKHGTKELFAAIEAAIRKLQKTCITVDLAKLFEAMPKYRKNYSGSAHLSGYLLPCHIVDAEINGQRTIAVELIAESPLMTVAKTKDQLISYDTAPLKISKQHNSKRAIVIKNWLLRRIALMKRGRLNNRSILMDTFYSECGLAESGDSTKQNARKIFFDVLDGFQSEGTILGYDIERGESNKYRSIKIKL